MRRRDLAPRTGWTALAAGGLVALAVAVRAINAWRYPPGFGFDGPANWRYVRLLLDSWALPPPGADWATAHPPLYYYANAALLRMLGIAERADAFVAVRLAGSAVGLVAPAAAVWLVRSVDPEDRPRALLAGALLLFLPVHVYLSAMFNEEVVAASLVSVAITRAALDTSAPAAPARPFARAAVCGLAAGLALLTKLSGLMGVVAAAAAYAWDGARRRRVGLALLRPALVVALALLVGGWYYARNLLEYGYLYPHGLEVHAEIRTYPPGERHWMDYVRLPFATWTDPRALAPGLLRSVWGTTYASTWFDVHRQFLPTEGESVNRVGTVILLLALLPTAAFGAGLARGARRAARGAPGPDPPLLLLVGLLLSGYVAFTWRNPWFVTAKASYLLGLGVPFAFYASEPLVRWARAPGVRGRAVWLGLLLLLGLVTATFTQGAVFWKWDVPGFRWVYPPGEAPRPEGAVRAGAPGGIAMRGLPASARRPAGRGSSDAEPLPAAHHAPRTRPGS